MVCEYYDRLNVAQIDVRPAYMSSANSDEAASLEVDHDTMQVIPLPLLFLYTTTRPCFLPDCLIILVKIHGCLRKLSR